VADLDGGHGRDHHGTFQASFATFAEACEAMCVLSQIQKDLFYAVGWDSWADRGRSDADGPRRPRREDDKRLEYLYRLSREARAESTPEESFTRSTRPWGEHREDVSVIEFDAGVKQIVHDCGYSSGRGVSGVEDRKTFAETIPPFDAYATRTPPNPKQGTTLATIEGYVTAAEQHGGGWVQLVFHHLCDGCDAYSISPANFTALLEWLQPRAASGTVVETTTQVIGGPVQPPVPG